MTVDIKQDRLAAINRHLMEDAEVAPGQWEMTALGADIKGKALLFKTVGAHDTESHSDFPRMPDNLTLAQAADILKAPIVQADNASHRSSGPSQEFGAERSSAPQTVSLSSRR